MSTFEALINARLNLSEAKGQWNAFKAELKQGVDITAKLGKGATSALKSATQFQKIQGSLTNGTYAKNISNMQKGLNDYYGQQSIHLDNASRAMKGYNNAYKTLQRHYDKNDSFVLDNDKLKTTSENMKKYSDIYKNSMAMLRNETSKTANQADVSKLQNQLQLYAKDNNKLNSNQRSRLQGLIEQSQNAKTVGDTRNIRSQFGALDSEAAMMGTKGKSWGASFVSSAKSLANFAITYGAIQKGISLVTNSVHELKEIDTTLTEIGKTSTTTSTELKQLGVDAFDSASKYGKTAQEYLVGVQEMSRSGFYGKKGEELAQLSILAQSAGDMSTDIANSYLLATNAAYEYGGSVEKLNRVLDGQNMITDRNSVSMTDMASATSKAASMAESTGMSIEDLSATIGVAVASTKQNGDVVGTALKSLFVNLQDTSNKKVKGTFDRLGISQTRSDGTNKTPIEILRELASAYSKLPEGSSMRSDILRNIGQKRQANMLAAILKGINSGDYDKMLKDYSEGTGSAEREAMMSANNWQGTQNKLSNAWTQLVSSFVNSDSIISAGNMLTGGLKGLQSMTQNLGGFTSLMGLMSFGKQAKGLLNGEGINGLFRYNKNTGFSTAFTDYAKQAQKDSGSLSLDGSSAIAQVESVSASINAMHTLAETPVQLGLDISKALAEIDAVQNAINTAKGNTSGVVTSNNSKGTTTKKDSTSSSASTSSTTSSSTSNSTTSNSGSVISNPKNVTIDSNKPLTVNTESEITTTTGSPNKVDGMRKSSSTSESQPFYWTNGSEVANSDNSGVYISGRKNSKRERKLAKQQKMQAKELAKVNEQARAEMQDFYSNPSLWDGTATVHSRNDVVNPKTPMADYFREQVQAQKEGAKQTPTQTSAPVPAQPIVPQNTNEAVETATKSSKVISKVQQGFGKATSAVAGFSKSILTMGLNMGTMMIASYAIEKAVGAVSDYIHRDEIAIEKGEEARTKIKQTTDAYKEQENTLKSLGTEYGDSSKSIKTQGDAIEAVSKKYAELSKGVNKATGENMSLSNDDYQSYLNINNKLADLYPSLVKSYDSSGNAILNLSSDASVATKQLQDVADQQQAIAHADIAENIQKAYKGSAKQSEKYAKEADKLKNDADSLRKQYDSFDSLNKKIESGYDFSKGITTDKADGISKDVMQQYADAIKKNGGYATVSEDIYGNERKLNVQGYDYLSDSAKRQIDKDIQEINNKEMDKTSRRSAENIQKSSSLERQSKDAWQDLVPSMQGYLQTNKSFSELNGTIQSALLNSVGGINFKDIAKSYDGNIEDFMYGEFLTPISDMSSEAQNQLANVFNIDKNKMSFDKYKKKVDDGLNQVFGDNKEEKNRWSNLLGMDDFEKEYNESMEKVSKGITGDTGKLDGLSSNDMQIAYDLVVNEGKTFKTFDELKKAIKETKAEMSQLDLNDHTMFDSVGTALESENAGTYYDKMTEYLKQGEELRKNGLTGTDDFKSIAAMFSPSGATDATNWDENVGKMKKYFTEGKDGAKAFLSDLKDLNLAQEENGKWDFNLGNIEESARKMGMATEPFMAMFGKLEDYGISNDIFNNEADGISHLTTLYGDLAKAQGELALLEKNDPENTTAIEEKKKEIKDLEGRRDNTYEGLANLSSQGNIDKYNENQKALKDAYSQAMEGLNSKEFKNLDSTTQEGILNQINSQFQEAGYENTSNGGKNKLGKWVADVDKSNQVIEKRQKGLQELTNAEKEYNNAVTAEAEAKKSGDGNAIQEAKKRTQEAKDNLEESKRNVESEREKTGMSKKAYDKRYGTTGTENISNATSSMGSGIASSITGFANGMVDNVGQGLNTASITTGSATVTAGSVVVSGNQPQTDANGNPLQPNGNIYNNSQTPNATQSQSQGLIGTLFTPQSWGKASLIDSGVQNTGFGQWVTGIGNNVGQWFGNTWSNAQQMFGGMLGGTTATSQTTQTGQQQELTFTTNDQSLSNLGSKVAKQVADNANKGLSETSNQLTPKADEKKTTQGVQKAVKSAVQKSQDVVKNALDFSGTQTSQPITTPTKTDKSTPTKTETKSESKDTVGSAGEKIMKIVADASEAESTIQEVEGEELSDKETTLTGVDNASPIISVWNSLSASVKSAILNGVDGFSAILGLWEGSEPSEKEATVTATDNASGAANKAKSAINSVNGKSVSVSASVSGLGSVQSLKNSIAGLHGKTITITTNYVTKGSKPNQAQGTFHPHAQGTFSAFASGTVSSNRNAVSNRKSKLSNKIERLNKKEEEQNRRNNLLQVKKQNRQLEEKKKKNLEKTRNAYASGSKVGVDKDQVALINELGKELVVNWKYFTYYFMRLKNLLNCLETPKDILTTT